MAMGFFQVFSLCIYYISTALGFESMDFQFSSSDITHCSFNPTACLLLCGTTNPDCDIMGQCQCTHHPSYDAECELPSFFDQAKCNTFNCHRRGHQAFLCTYGGEKICVCSPPPPSIGASTGRNSSIRRRRRLFIDDPLYAA